MNTVLNTRKTSRFLIIAIAVLILSLYGVSAPALAATTTPTSYVGSSIGKQPPVIQSFNITQFNGRGIFFGNITVGGITYTGYGRYVGATATLLFSWFTYSSTGLSTYQGDFTGKFGPGFLTITGAFNKGTQTGAFSLKAA